MFLGTLVALLVINIVIAKVGVKVKYTETFIGGIPSDEYFEYVKQGMSTRAIRKMMAEIDANNKVELAMKAKEEAEKLEAEADKLSAEAKAAEAAGDSDAGHKTQLAAQAVDAAAKKAMEAADLAREATAAVESLKQFNEPGLGRRGEGDCLRRQEIKRTAALDADRTAIIKKVTIHSYPADCGLCFSSLSLF